MGGPVRIPKIYNGKDKTFFFFSYEGFRNRNGATNVTAHRPTAEMYNGDFSKWVTSAGAQIPIYNPITQMQNADGTCDAPGISRTTRFPKSLFNPASVQALSVFQSSGTLPPNNGAAPGTVGVCQQQLPVNSRVPGLPGQQVEHQGRSHLQRQAPHLRLLRVRSRAPRPPVPTAPPPFPACIPTTTISPSPAMSSA